MNDPRILIIDDDEDMAYTLARMVAQAGCGSRSAASLVQGRAAVAAEVFDVVFLDVHLPDGSGLTLIPELKRLPDPPEIIILTAYGDPEGAAVALKSDVWDYITKPARVDEIRLPMLRALEYRAQKRQNLPMAVQRSAIIGNAAALNACIERLALIARSEANVLISGETGTGKELFAQAIHANSRRAGGPFVVVDCTALPDQLVESILFGHARGAFTGADRTQRGLIRRADGGTLFLDELGELPLALQKTFLRVIQERRFRPVGAKRQEQSDFRLVAATNRDLDRMADQDLFRKDLLHRVRTLTLTLPPLRERLEDIPVLVIHHMARLCARQGQGPKGIAPEVFDLLAAWNWPGNVRELVNTLEGAITAAYNEPTIFACHLPTHLRIRLKAAQLEGGRRQGPGAVGEAADKGPPDAFPKLRDALDAARRNYLVELMARSGGNVPIACRLSGLSRTTLYNHLNKYGLLGPR